MPFSCLSEEIAAAPVPMEITPSQRMMSACAGVLTVSMVVTPMDVVKTRVQAEQAEAVTRQSASTRATAEACDICGQQQGRLYTTSARAPSPGATLAGFDASISASAVGAAVRERPPALPTGTLAGLHHIARWEGIRSLYRGLEISLVMAIPSTVLYYTVYDLLLEELEKAGAGKFLAPATAGSSARTLSTAVMAPLELVRTRAQSERAAVSGVAEKDFSGASLRGSGGGVGGAGASVGKMLATVFKEEGAAALWRGVGTTMWRDVPFSMMYWLGYENLKSGLGCGRDVDGGHQGARGAGKSAAEERGSADFLTRSFTAGAVSGMFAGLVTQPFDVVKTQQQLIFKGASATACEHCPAPPQRHPGTFEVMRNIVDSKGVRALFTGGTARVVKVAPACAIMMLSYEAGKRFFGQRNAEAKAQAEADARRHQ